MVTLHSTGSQPPRFRVLAFLAAGYIVSAFLLAPSQVTADVSQAIGATTASLFVIHAMQRNALHLHGELTLLGRLDVYTLVSFPVSMKVTTVVSRAMTLTQS